MSGPEVFGLCAVIGWICFGAGMCASVMMDGHNRRVAAERFRREHGEFGWRVKQ